MMAHTSSRPSPPVVPPKALGKKATFIWVGLALIIYAVSGWYTNIAASIFNRLGYSVDPHALPWAAWELGALVLTSIFTVVFYFTFPLPNPKSWTLDKIIIVFVTIGTVLCSWLAIRCVGGKASPHWHPFWVGCISIVFLIGDWYLFKHPSAAHLRKAFLFTVVFIDIPAIFALFFLWFWQYMFHSSLSCMEAFVAGAIAFQLLSANVTFALIQAKIAQ